jgi:signal peptidase I
MTRANKILISIVALFLLVILIGAVWAFSSFRVVRVPTGSMANTIIPGDRVLCRLGADKIERGEIVLFRLPDDPKVIYLKRVIGLPGETIQFQGMKVLINGQELAEARIIIDPGNDSGSFKGLLREVSAEGRGKYRVYYAKRESEFDDGTRGMRFGVREPIRIPERRYFLLGDSRDNALDSRYYGPVPRENLIGKALMILDSEAPGGEKRTFISLQVK